LAAEGIANDEIGTRLSVPRQIVSKWRKRFFEQRTVGLQDEVRSGRPPAFSP
jgi:transposase